jgi:hypothetical protein
MSSEMFMNSEEVRDFEGGRHYMCVKILSPYSLRDTEEIDEKISV